MDQPSGKKPNAPAKIELTFLDRKARGAARSLSGLGNKLTGKITEEVLMSNIMEGLKKAKIT